MAMSKRRGLIATVALAAMAASAPAFAHPHVWTEMRSQLLLDDSGLVVGVRMQWTTDKDYAKLALEGMDSNNDGIYQPEELAQLTAENLSALADYDYFVHFRFNDEKQDHGVASDGIQHYNDKDGRLTLVFTVPLQQPLDPHKGEVSLKIYDPEFYISFDYVAEKPLLISKPLPAGCTAELLPVPSDTAVEETKAMLATKGKDWKPDTEEDYGGMFAQKAVMRCAP
jgi:ABC-type uncharacterized transport system substrate-binding protein